MTIQPTTLHTDSSGRVTAQQYGDLGDGVNGWHGYTRAADGADATIGAQADASITDPTVDASVVALLKGTVEKLADVEAAVGGGTAGTPMSSAALVNVLAVKATAGELLSVVGYSTLDQFLQVFNAATATGTPLVVIPIIADAPFSIDFGELGLACSVGITVANSTTGPTYSAGAADTYITAIYR